MMQNFRKDFPLFGELDVELPPGFVDDSDEHEACPSFKNSAINIRIYVNYGERSLWEFPETMARFRVQGLGVNDTLLLTDDWDEVLELLAQYASGRLIQFPRS
jgi:hypothetical protein